MSPKEEDSVLLAQTLNFINSATKERLQETLITVCQGSREALLQVASCLTVQEKGGIGSNRKVIWSGEDEASLGDETSGTPTTGHKRKRLQFTNEQRYEMCVNCDQEFDTTNNGPCVYHWGSLDIDEESDAWADHWDGDGPRDTEDMRIDAPDGFKWTCCGGNGEAEGCQKELHVPNVMERDRSWIVTASKQVENKFKKVRM